VSPKPRSSPLCFGALSFGFGQFAGLLDFPLSCCLALLFGHFFRRLMRFSQCIYAEGVTLNSPVGAKSYLNAMSPWSNLELLSLVLPGVVPSLYYTNPRCNIIQ
jgi:hypothetical protein